jgi:hypothetical protein
MSHPSPEELLEKMRVAREAWEADGTGPERLERHRELVECCPAFTPNLLEYARLLPRVEAPHVEGDAMLAEVQRTLELAVQGSNRGVAEVLAYAHFMDTFRGSPEQAERLYTEGAAKALGHLEDAWTSLIDFWTLENKKETLVKALELATLAEKVFPDSISIQLATAKARDFAAHAGLTSPDGP